MTSADKKRGSKKRPASDISSTSSSSSTSSPSSPSSSSVVVHSLDADVASGDAALSEDVTFLPSVRADVVFAYRGLVFRLHSQFLQRYCSLFAAMTEPASEWGALCMKAIPDVDVDVFRVCMRLLYEPAEIAGWVKKAEIEQLLPMLRLSSHVGFSALIDACQAGFPEKIEEVPSVSKQGCELLSAVWSFATEPGLKRMRDAVLTVIANDITTFGYRGVYQHLSTVPMWQSIQKDELLFIIAYIDKRNYVPRRIGNLGSP